MEEHAKYVNKVHSGAQVTNKTTILEFFRAWIQHILERGCNILSAENATPIQAAE